MRDWNSLVRKQIGRLKGVDAAQQEEIIAELAGHLEDACDEQREERLGEPIDRTLHTAADWGDLARKIRRAKSTEGRMNDRTRQLWLPGLVSLMVANLMLMILLQIGFQPSRIASLSASWFPGLALVAVYAPWLVAQPLVGTLGAYLSYKSGGGRFMRLSAALFPAAVTLGLWCVVIPASAFIERNLFAMRHPAYLALGALGCVAPSGMALLLGALPFLMSPDF